MTSRFCKVNVEPPEKPNMFKPIFNWLHWMFGSINYVLAGKPEKKSKIVELMQKLETIFANTFHARVGISRNLCTSVYRNTEPVCTVRHAVNPAATNTTTTKFRMDSFPFMCVMIILCFVLF